jgi:signal transduction histidine kinase
MTARGPPFTVVHVRARIAQIWSRRDPVKIDTALAIVLMVSAELAIWFGGDASHHQLPAALLAPVMTLPIAVRRRYPLFAGVVVTTAAAIDHSFWDPQFIAYPIAEFCALYGLAVWTPPRRFAVGVAAFVGSAFVTFAITDGSVEGLKGTIAFTVVALVVMLLVRRVVRDREQRAELAERERDVTAREAVVEERTRIAREMHDAIAHNVSMIVLQAGAERRVLDESRDSTRETLEAIEQTGRSALTEMRRMVGMLRSDKRDPLAPQPSLADLSTLVTQVTEAGLPVELRVEGEPRALPVGIELSAYRIIQEALTNTLKHAGGGHASVYVRYGDTSLELEICDDGTGSAASVTSGGHGLVGMRERVALYGGRLDAGQRPGGGFEVRVLLPIR